MKKKKKTIYLRKIRKRSTNKSYRYSFHYFRKLISFYLLKFVKNDNFKACLFSFINSFFCTNKNVVFNIIKNFGFVNNCIFFLKIKKSVQSKILVSKFKKEVKFKNLNKIRVIKVFKKGIYKRLRKFSVDSWDQRYYNVENKKKMTLYFSYRHLLELPVRGQRTKTNAKIRKNYNII